jgi:hypothetical protein
MQEYFVYGFLLTYLYSLAYRLQYHQGDVAPNHGRSGDVAGSAQ